jgi:hypothetical protein
MKEFIDYILQSGNLNRQQTDLILKANQKLLPNGKCLKKKYY